MVELNEYVYRYREIGVEIENLVSEKKELIVKIANEMGYHIGDAILLTRDNAYFNIGKILKIESVSSEWGGLTLHGVLYKNDGSLGNRDARAHITIDGELDG